uniref:Disease resistance R13L4/SHOC-2-like LRR domain-containing protein n=1 Tax=Setaria italica TaxID=4555 RepID=K3ZN84_SETIT
MASNRTNHGQFSIGALSLVATMHRIGIAAMLVLSSCFLFLATHAQQQPQPAASDNTASLPSCIPHERDALLPPQLVAGRRWPRAHDEQDCCRWRGVRCSNRTGHVHKLRLRGNYYEERSTMEGKISPSLLALDHLEHLDLSCNDLAGPTGRLPEFLGSLKSLKYLNLSYISFQGSVPPQLGNLSRLQHLDLSNMQDTNSMDLSWLTRLPSIEYLNLNGVNLSTVVDWPHVMNMLPSLRVLRLSSCSLASANQSLPHLNLTNLEELDASGNSFNHPMVTSWFWNITSLKYLYLGLTRMYGQFPDALGDMISLQVLDLSLNFYYHDDDKYRVMTTDLKNLCNLEVLSLYSSLLHGDVTELLRNLPRCSHNKLQELDLRANQLTGMLPRWIAQFAGLRTLDLSYNNLRGNVPYEIGKLSNLTYLGLNNNKLDGVITEEHFVSARSLQYIDLSYNALKIEISSDWQPPSRLDIAIFAACQMGPLFPGWLQWHVNITHLDISSAGIADRFPQWFSDAFSNVEFLNISNNQLNGSLPTNMGFMSLRELSLSSNQLTGQIPTLPPNISTLDLSNNFLSGPLPYATRSANLKQLSLFSNQITGHISESFCKYQGLFVLDLSNNFLEGVLPLCLGVMEDVEILGLRNNSLSGGFPSFVQNLTNIMFIDLSMNNFSGRLPTWIGKLTQLRILQLSHNKFSGNIPVNITNLACLQYMDLNNNEISGSLSSYLSNLKSMGNTIDKCMMSIDLSSNNLIGEIPEEIVVLGALVNLNLSRNHLTGVIPNKIGEMQSLQSLDFSRNKLSGEIPVSLSNITFLSDLDLSYNNLTGRIPSGPQLDTIYAEHPTMYIGNIGLCGHPLQNNCSSEDGRIEHFGLVLMRVGLARSWSAVVSWLVAWLVIVRTEPAAVLQERKRSVGPGAGECRSMSGTGEERLPAAAMIRRVRR